MSRSASCDISLCNNTSSFENKMKYQKESELYIHLH